MLEYLHEQPSLPRLWAPRTRHQERPQSYHIAALSLSNCRRYFTVERKPHGYDLALRKQALKLYLEGTSFRAIGRLLGVHHQSVSNWITEAANALPTQITDTTPAETIELDELYTYVQQKKTTSTS